MDTIGSELNHPQMTQRGTRRDLQLVAEEHLIRPTYSWGILAGCLGWMIGLLVTWESMGTCEIDIDAWIPGENPNEWGFRWGTVAVSLGAAAFSRVVFWHYMRSAPIGRRLFSLVIFALAGASWWLPVFMLRDGVASYGASSCAVSDSGLFGWFQGAMWLVVIVSWLGLLGYVVFGPLPPVDTRSDE